MDVNKIEKVFCESVNLAYSPEFFVMVVNDKGELPLAYAFTPEHMKRLHQYIGAHIGDYEKKFGQIEASWDPGIQSPIQPTDLGDIRGKNRGKNSCK